MRDALFVAGRQFAPELAAQHAGRDQFRRGLSLDNGGSPTER